MHLLNSCKVLHQPLDTGTVVEELVAVVLGNKDRKSIATLMLCSRPQRATNMMPSSMDPLHFLKNLEVATG